MDRPRWVEILGVRVDDVTEEEALAYLEALWAGGGQHQIVTPNAEILMAARRDPEFRAILNAASLALPDGFGLLFAAWLQGTPLRAQVTGTDLVVRLSERAAARGGRVFYLGARPGVAAACAARLARRFPGLVVAGAEPGAPDPASDDLMRARRRAAGPIDLLFVAYGAPKQERWIARNLPHLPVRLAMGVGGAFDFISGRVRRAPPWVRRRGFDWLYRLAMEPWRWRRQLALPQFAALAVATAVRQRLAGRPRGSEADYPSAGRRGR